MEFLKKYKLRYGTQFSDESHIKALDIRNSRMFYVVVILCYSCADFSQKITNLAPDTLPPANMSVKNTPQFIFIGSDDQRNYEGMENLLNMFKDYKNPQGKGQKATFDGEPVRFSFYSGSSYQTPELMGLHQRAFNEGHEIGLHTHSHPFLSSRQETIDEFSRNISEMTKVITDDRGDTIRALNASFLKGVRAPFLYVSDWVFDALDTLNLRYDCSLEEGMDTTIRSPNGFVWPYTADGGASPGWIYLSDVMKSVPNRLLSHPGKWEIPAYPLFFIPDSLKEKYGITRPEYDANRHNRDMFNRRQKGEIGVSLDGKKLSGLDWDTWFIQNWTGDELAMTLLYNLELRLAGNRVPLTFCIHSRFYANEYPDHIYGLKKFIDMALSFPEVRFVTGNQLIDWMENPVGLE